MPEKSIPDKSIIDKSILGAVLWRVLAVTLLYTGCLFFVADTQLNTTLVLLRDKVMTDRAADIGSYLERNAAKKLVLDMPHALARLYAASGGDYQYLVRNAKGEALFGSPVVLRDYFPASAPPGPAPLFFEFTGPKGRDFVGEYLWVSFEKTPYLVEVAHNKDAASEFPRHLTDIYLTKISVLGIPFLAFLVFGIVLSVRRSLAPVTKTSQQAQKISFSSPGIRLGDRDFPKEIRPLVQAVNMALERMEAGIVAQKEFTAHAAHELRTPLSILQAHIELLGDKPQALKLRRDVETMNRLVTQLLSAARLEFPDGLPMEKTDLAAVTRDVCAAIWPLMLKQNVQLDVRGIEAPVWIEGNYDSLFGALRNVIENAMHYAPKGTAVDVVLDGDKPQITVRDRGPGIPDEDKNRVFERFWRKDSTKGPGAGIGLYIVRRTVALHGGQVRVEDAPGGGCVFALAFPAFGTSRLA